MLNNPLIWWNIVLIVGAIDKIIVDSQFSENFDLNGKSIHSRIVRINWRCSHFIVSILIFFAIIITILWIVDEEQIFPKSPFNICGYAVIIAGYLSSISLGKRYAISAVAKILAKHLDENVLGNIEESVQKEKIDARRSIRSNDRAGFPGDNGRWYKELKKAEQTMRLLIETRIRKGEKA